MAYPIDNNIIANAPRPLDAKVVVGSGMEYLNKEDIPITNKYDGMIVLDNITKLEWIFNVNKQQWKVWNLDVMPLFYNITGTLLPGNTKVVSQGSVVKFQALYYGNIESVEWWHSETGLISRETILNYTFNNIGSSTIQTKITDIYGNTVIKNTVFNVIEDSVIQTTMNVIPATSFNIEGTLLQYNFQIELGKPILANEFIQFKISWGSNEVSFLDGQGNLKSGVILSGNNITLNDFPEFLLDLQTETTFDLFIQTTNFEIINTDAIHEVIAPLEVIDVIVSPDTILYNQLRNYTFTVKFNRLTGISSSQLYVEFGSMGIDPLEVLLSNNQSQIQFSRELTFEQAETFIFTVTDILNNITEINTYNLELEPFGYSATFNVTSNLPGGPLQGATVYINGQNVGTTNSSGQLVVTPLEPASYTYEVTKSGYLTSNGFFEITNSNKTIDIELINANLLNNTITNFSIAPVNVYNDSGDFFDSINATFLNPIEGNSIESIKILRAGQLFNIPISSSNYSISGTNLTIDPSAVPLTHFGDGSHVKYNTRLEYKETGYNSIESSTIEITGQPVIEIASGGISHSKTEDSATIFLTLNRTYSDYGVNNSYNLQVVVDGYLTYSYSDSDITKTNASGLTKLSFTIDQITHPGFEFPLIINSIVLTETLPSGLTSEDSASYSITDDPQISWGKLFENDNFVPNSYSGTFSFLNDKGYSFPTIGGDYNTPLTSDNISTGTVHYSDAFSTILHESDFSLGLSPSNPSTQIDFNFNSIMSGSIFNYSYMVVPKTSDYGVNGVYNKLKYSPDTSSKDLSDDFFHTEITFSGNDYILYLKKKGGAGQGVNPTTGFLPYPELISDRFIFINE